MLEFGGVDLESYQLTSLAQIQSVLGQVLSSLSLAEERLAFEHRDLHLGNILINPTHRADIRLGNYQSIPTEGILSSIIDCSLARFKDDKGEANVQFRDLCDDEWLFIGDSSASRQYQIYRDMRELVGEDWKAYHPKTNLLWIAYMTTSLLDKYERFQKKDKELYAKLRTFSKDLMNFENCKEAFKALYQ